MAELNTKVVTGKIRFSYLHVFKPKLNDDGTPGKYGACLLIPKRDTVTVDKINKAIEAARLGSAELFKGKVPARLRSPMHDGDKEKPNGGEWGEECKGCWVINAGSNNKPGIVDRQMNEIVDPGEFVSGDYGRASLNFFVYNSSGNTGVGCGLNNIQFLSKGVPLAGNSRPEDDFKDAYEDDEDDLGI